MSSDPLQPAVAPSPRGDRWARALTVPGLLLLVVVAFAGVWRCQFLHYDDNIYVTANAFVLDGITLDGLRWAWTTFHAGNYHPLTWMSLMLDAQLWGEDPRGYHAFNAALHAVNAVLVFLVLRSLTGAHWRSAAAAALFALHPLRVESVAWASERKDVLSAALGLLALLAYCRYARRPRPAAYALLPLFMALSLLAKPMLVTLPFLLLLLDYWPLGRLSLAGHPAGSLPERACPPTPTRVLLLEKIPLLALSAASCVATFLAQSHGGAVRSTDEKSLPLRLANAVVSCARYLGKMVWFDGLSIEYPYPPSWAWWQVVGAAAIVGGVTVLALAWLRSRPHVAVGWFWFVGLLAPVIGIVQVGHQSMADRYTYLPAIGLAVAVVWSLPAGLGRRPAAWWTWGGAAVVLAILTAFTQVQVRHWHDDTTLMRQALRVDGRNWIAHGNLGDALFRAGQPQAAIAEYRQALQIRPDYPWAQLRLAEALRALNQNDAAMREFRLAIEADPDDPRARFGLADLLLATGDANGALQQLREVVKRRPRFEVGHVNLARLLLQMGQAAQAAKHLEEAIVLDPEMAEAHYFLGLALANQGQTEPALQHLRRAAAILPSNEQIRLAIDAVAARSAPTTQR